MSKNGFKTKKNHKTNITFLNLLMSVYEILYFNIYIVEIAKKYKTHNCDYRIPRCF